MVERHVFSGDRDAVRMQAVDAALGLLVRRLSQ
jgi:nicotinamide mononucleotide (NMN) deamidase PncC